MKAISTKSAPSAIGPYSQGTICNGFLFASGQIPLVPETMTIQENSIEGQTRQVLKNLEVVLTEAGTSWSRVVKTTIFLTDLTNFKTVNEIYNQCLGGAKPARSTVQVAALPLNAQVEIELIAEV
jgi:2-iminobutanoate/2-iminopropanoate deaminase